MFDRFRLAFREFWSDDETATLYCRARHAAQVRIAADPLPQPDTGVIQRMRARESRDLLRVVRRAGW